MSMTKRLAYEGLIEVAYRTDLPEGAWPGERRAAAMEE
jgi:hypothetical protein